MLLLKLFLAHLIGDFFLQPVSWIREKEKNRWRSSRLFLHVLIHFALILILLWDFSYWKVAVIIAVSHYIIDAVKLNIQNDSTRSFWFYSDQLFHLLVITGVWIYLVNGIELPALTDNFFIVFTGLVFLITPASFIIQHTMNKWDGQIVSDQTDSLKGAGKYIGILERLFIYGSVLTGNLQVIGFLLAAKSVFRFGDLTRSKDRKLTEYIMVGTLLSFVIAVTTAMLVVYFLRG